MGANKENEVATKSESPNVFVVSFNEVWDAISSIVKLQQSILGHMKVVTELIRDLKNRVDSLERKMGK